MSGVAVWCGRAAGGQTVDRKRGRKSPETGQGKGTDAGSENPLVSFELTQSHPPGKWQHQRRPFLVSYVQTRTRDR